VNQGVDSLVKVINAKVEGVDGLNAEEKVKREQEAVCHWGLANKEGTTDEPREQVTRVASLCDSVNSTACAVGNSGVGGGSSGGEEGYSNGLQRSRWVSGSRGNATVVFNDVSTIPEQEEPLMLTSPAISSTHVVEQQSLYTSGEVNKNVSSVIVGACRYMPEYVQHIATQNTLTSTNSTQYHTGTNSVQYRDSRKAEMMEEFFRCQCITIAPITDSLCSHLHHLHYDAALKKKSSYRDDGLYHYLRDKCTIIGVIEIETTRCYGNINAQSYRDYKNRSVLSGGYAAKMQIQILAFFAGFFKAHKDCFHCNSSIVMKKIGKLSDYQDIARYEEWSSASLLRREDYVDYKDTTTEAYQDVLEDYIVMTFNNTSINSTVVLQSNTSANLVTSPRSKTGSVRLSGKVAYWPMSNCHALPVTERDKSSSNSSGSLNMVDKSTGSATCDSNSLDKGSANKRTIGLQRISTEYGLLGGQEVDCGWELSDKGGATDDSRRNIQKVSSCCAVISSVCAVDDSETVSHLTAVTSEIDNSTQEAHKSISNNSSRHMNEKDKSSSMHMIDMSVGIVTGVSSRQGWTDKKNMGTGTTSETGASRKNKGVLDGQKGKKMVEKTSIGSFFTKSNSSDKKNNGGGVSGEELHSSGLQRSRLVSGPLWTAVANSNVVRAASEQAEVLKVREIRPTHSTSTRTRRMVPNYKCSGWMKMDSHDTRECPSISPNFGMYNGKLYCTQCALLAGCVYEAARLVTKKEWTEMHSDGGGETAVCDDYSDVCDDRGSGAPSLVSSTHRADMTINNSRGSFNIVDKSTGSTVYDSNNQGGGWTDRKTMGLDIHSETGASGSNKGDLDVQKGRNRVDRRSAASYFAKNTSSDKKSNRGDSSDMGLHNSGLQRSSPVRGPLGMTETNVNAISVYKSSSSVAADKENNSESLSSGVQVDRLARQAGWDPPL
jgi:hypothetical protein